MSRAISQLIIMLSGAGLILLGSYLTYVQIFKTVASAGSTSGGATLTGFNLVTDHPGVVIIVMGVLLEIVGFLGPRRVTTDVSPSKPVDENPS
jgi:hypothetical protein